MAATGVISVGAVTSAKSWSHWGVASWRALGPRRGYAARAPGVDPRLREPTSACGRIASLQSSVAPRSLLIRNDWVATARHNRTRLGLEPMCPPGAGSGPVRTYRHLLPAKTQH